MENDVLSREGWKKITGLIADLLFHADYFPCFLSAEWNLTDIKSFYLLSARWVLLESYFNHVGQLGFGRHILAWWD